MKIEEHEYKKLSEDFCKAWDNLKLEKAEKEFLEAIESIILFGKPENGKAGMDDSYNAHMIYSSAAKAIESFNELFHVINITIGWKDEK